MNYEQHEPRCPTSGCCCNALADKVAELRFAVDRLLLKFAERLCDYCDGTGRFKGKSCGWCNGSGIQHMAFSKGEPK